MLLIGNLNFFVYLGINEGIQILTIVILVFCLLTLSIVLYGIFLAAVPWEYIGGPYCSATEDVYCSSSRKKGGSYRPSGSSGSSGSSGPSQSCKVFGLSID